MKLEETLIERHTIGRSGDYAPHVLSSFMMDSHLNKIQMDSMRLDPCKSDGLNHCFGLGGNHREIMTRLNTYSP